MHRSTSAVVCLLLRLVFLRLLELIAIDERLHAAFVCAHVFVDDSVAGRKAREDAACR